MFKRAAKRQRKREKEEELGLDGDMKQVLGLQDTDSDESVDSSSESGDASDLDSPSGEESGFEDVNHIGHTPTRRKRKRPVDSPQSIPQIPGKKSDSDSESSVGDSYIDVDDAAGPPMGVMAAITDPIYDLPGASPTQDFRACVLCPGKLLKNAKMTKVHVESAAHRRRLQRYSAEVSKLASSPEGLNTDDPRDILRDMIGVIHSQTPDQAGVSRRSQRRAQSKAKRIERKKARKEKRAKMSEDKGGHKDTAISDTVAKNDVEKIKKRRKKRKATDTGADAVLRTVNPSPAQIPAKKEVMKAKIRNAEPTSDMAAPIHPTKRRKGDAQTDTNTSPLPDLKACPSPSTKSTFNKTDGGVRAGPSLLERHNTSFYFADDENPTPPGDRLTQRKKKGKHDLASGVREPKTVATATGRNDHAPLQGNEEKSNDGTPKKGSLREAKRHENRGKIWVDDKGQKKRTAASASRKGKESMLGKRLGARR